MVNGNVQMGSEAKLEAIMTDFSRRSNAIIPDIPAPSRTSDVTSLLEDQSRNWNIRPFVPWKEMQDHRDEGSQELRDDVHPLVEETRFLWSLCENAGVSRDTITPNVAERMHLLRDFDQDVTYPHSVNVGTIAARFGTYLNQTLGRSYNVPELLAGGLQHDIGKLRIPYEIIAKTGDLDQDERRLMSHHGLYGAMILKSDPSVPARVIDIVLNHHPKLNEKPSSYQKRTSDDAKLLTMVDQYVAFREERSYKDRWSHMFSIKALEDSARKGLIDKGLLPRFHGYWKTQGNSMYQSR